MANKISSREKLKWKYTMLALFKSFKIEGHTLSWSNGADFAPEFFHDNISY
jgi:hypothetical protein